MYILIKPKIANIHDKAQNYISEKMVYHLSYYELLSLNLRLLK